MLPPWPQPLRQAGFHGPVMLEPDPRAAIDVALTRATGPTDAVLVTGSLYLVGNVRGRWYPDEDVLRARTPWPAKSSASPAGSPAP